MNAYFFNPPSIDSTALTYERERMCVGSGGGDGDPWAPGPLLNTGFGKQPLGVRHTALLPLTIPPSQSYRGMPLARLLNECFEYMNTL